MKEAAISQSPYVINPEIFLDEKEVEKLYKLRIDETYRPYTVFDVLSKVFRRSYSDDLLSYMDTYISQVAFAPAASSLHGKLP